MVSEGINGITRHNRSGVVKDSNEFNSCRGIFILDVGLLIFFGSQVSGTVKPQPL